MCTGITSYYESVSPNSICLWWRPQSDKFPGDTDAAGPWTTLWLAGKRPLQKWLKGALCWCGGQRQDSSHQPLPSFSKSSLSFDVLRLSSCSDQLWIELITKKMGSCVQTTSTSQSPCSLFSDWCVLVHMFLREPWNYSPSRRWSERQRIWMCSVAQSCLTLYDPPWTIARQAPLSLKFSRQECWSG